MARLDHSKPNARDRIARNGTDRINDFDLPAGMSPPKARPSKAALRAELAQAEAKITRIVRCRCGHKASLRVTPAMTGKRFRCSQCGEVAQ